MTEPRTIPANVRVGSRLCEKSNARRRRRKFFSTIVRRGGSMLLMHPEMQFGRMMFSAFCQRATFHTAWVKNGSVRARAARPFCPQEQISSACPGMSVWCQDRTGGRACADRSIGRGPTASPRLSRRHIGGFTPSAPITTAAASEPSLFITMKTLRPTASWSAGALSKATTVALGGMVIVCSPPL
jgi:hypothetical protein